MLIALDYDGTYTEDPSLWDAFIKLAQCAWHDIVCVTMRFSTAPVEMPIKVFYTCWKAKKPFIESHGIQVDVWIDDSPHWVLMDAKLPDPADEIAPTA